MSLSPDSNDQEILEHTTQDEKYVFITLPDGHQVKAEKPIKFNEWCAAVRDTIAARVENAEAERKARKQRQGLGTDLPAPESKGGDIDDPLEYAKKQEEHWLARLHTLKDQAVELEVLLEKASENYTKWNKIVEVLGGQHSSSDIHSDPSPDNNAGSDRVQRGEAQSGKKGKR